MMAHIDPRRVVGGQVHVMANNFTHPSECKKLFGSNWDSIFLNGTVIQCYDQAMPSNMRPSTFIVATCIILGTQKTKDLNKISGKKGLSPLQLKSKCCTGTNAPIHDLKNMTMTSITEAMERNIMAAHSPGGALFAPPNNDVIDPPGTAMIAPPAVPAEAEEYVLRNLTMGPRTPPPGATQP